jgi:small subunit ribosomal protein S3
MGQKVNPVGFRSSINKEWQAQWYANKNAFGSFLGEDLLIRKYFSDSYKESGISSVNISRSNNSITIDISTAKIGVLIGRSGEKANKMELDIKKIINKKVKINISQLDKPDLDATVVAENICRQLERRMMFRRVATKSIKTTMDNGAKGIRVTISGRLGGAEMARSEFFTEGSVPLQTMRSNISYCCDRAETTYGTLGVKVWIYTGDRFNK